MRQCRQEEGEEEEEERRRKEGRKEGEREGGEGKEGEENKEGIVRIPEGNMRSNDLKTLSQKITERDQRR